MLKTQDQKIMKNGVTLGLLSILSILTIASTLSTSIYAQENITEINQIPQTAKGPEIPSKGYLVEEIRDDLF